MSDRSRLVTCIFPCLLTGLAAALPAQASRPATAAGAWTQVQQKGFAYLLTQQKDGVFSARPGSPPDVGVHALALAALQSKPESMRSDDEKKTIAKGLDWLASQQDDEGSFGGQVPNYNTCAAMLALTMSGDARFRDRLAKAQRFVLGIQHVEGKGYAKADPDYGSVSYGGRREGRGDLSNLSFALEALRASGLTAEDEAVKKAVVFLQRTQNLRSVNDAKVKTKRESDGVDMTVESGDDGGAVYYPGNSPMGYVELSDGTRVARSYGSMTYALLKAYLLAGLPADDPRVAAAVRWIAKNWTVEHNPGADPKLPEKTKYSGLFYQYMLMAKALALFRADRLRGERDGKPVEIDWRRELREHLAQLQKPDGSWVNDRDDRWWENVPLLVTAYVLLALQHC